MQSLENLYLPTYLPTYGLPRVSFSTRITSWLVKRGSNPFLNDFLFEKDNNTKTKTETKTENNERKNARMTLDLLTAHCRNQTIA